MVGRMGAPVFVAVRTVSLTDLKRHLPSYQEAWTAAGHPGRGDVGVSIPLYVAETARQAREEAEASTMVRSMLVSPPGAIRRRSRDPAIGRSHYSFIPTYAESPQIYRPVRKRADIG